jgi:predicted GIY-YIG superfamily endonuclease
MFWNRNKNPVCEYWDCRKEARKEGTLCPEHYKMWEEGLLDKCPRCGRMKDSVYYLCLDCYVGRKIKRKKPEPAPRMPSWSRRLDQYVAGIAGIDDESARCYVYILEVGDGTLYVGHTQDIQDRLKEVRKPKKSVRTAQPPKLRYLEFLNSEKKAKRRVIELREFAAINPGYIDTLSQEFFSNMQRIGFDISS